jgi:hypothetical protein
MFLVGGRLKILSQTYPRVGGRSCPSFQCLLACHLSHRLLPFCQVCSPFLVGMSIKHKELITRLRWALSLLSLYTPCVFLAR